MDGYAGNHRSGLQAFLDDLSFERFGVRSKYADTIALNAGVR